MGRGKHHSGTTKIRIFMFWSGSLNFKEMSTSLKIDSAESISKETRIPYFSNPLSGVPNAHTLDARS
jgi:hypothetical protein